MKRLISTLIALSMLVAMSAPAFTTYGQNPNSGQQPDPANDPLGPGHAIMHKLPNSGRIGSTPERKAALNNLSPEDKEKVKQIFRDMVAKAKQNDDLKKHQDDDLPTSLTVSFKDKDGNRQLRTAKRQKKGESTLTSALKVKGHNRYITLASTTAPSNGMILKSSYTRTVAGVKRAHALKKASAPQATSDGDQDGLPDEFENQVADTFTPHYHISAGEADQFATFNDSPVAPETINQLFGQTPVSHFRVHKEGFGTDASGATVSVLRIDYLTIWNQDDGLVGGAACAWSWLGLDDVVQALSGHYLDHERSAMLIAAPVSDGDYNLDPGSYSIYNIYTAGHEFTVGDTSMYWNFFYSPVPAYNHIELMLSQCKHATYTFNPDYMPLTPWYIIVGTYASLDLAYWEGWIPWYWYLAALAIADDVFFGCVVERFTDQGGQYAAVRTDVGEPGVPINNSSFIAVPDINKQFTTPYFRW